MATNESVIRRMTRLADRHQAINLAQGFTDEAPPYPMVWEAVATLLGGTDSGIDQLRRTTVGDLVPSTGADASGVRLKEALATLCASRDQFSQYSFPFGLAELRDAIADYTKRWCGFRPNPESETTVVLGATEGLASVFAGVCAPGDGVIILEPFHEMYPSQAGVFGLRPIYLTLREGDGQWCLDRDELVRAAAGSRLLVLNTPHNPTGKVFTRDELRFIAEVAVEYDLLVITDEIYEQITYDGQRHVPLAAERGMRERTIIINSISKTGSATGWRVGWVIAPEPYTARIRAVHDTLVIQAPTPLQKAAVRLLTMPAPFFDALRSHYARKRQALVTVLAEVGFRFAVPQGAYYLFTDYQAVPALRGKSPMEAAVFLIEGVGIAAVPGDGFFATPGSGATHLRFAFCRSLATLEEAAHRLTKLA